MALAITRTELSADGLRAAARGTKDSYQARRLLALALVLDGASRTAAAQAVGMDRQTLRDWVHRYNAQGVEGLCDRPRSGRPPQLCEAELAEHRCLVSGDRETVHQAGISVRGRTVSENDVPVENLEDFIVAWPGEKPGEGDG